MWYLVTLILVDHGIGSMSKSLQQNKNREKLSLAQGLPQSWQSRYQKSFIDFCPQISPWQLIISKLEILLEEFISLNLKCYPIALDKA